MLGTPSLSPLGAVGRIGCRDAVAIIIYHCLEWG